MIEHETTAKAVFRCATILAVLVLLTEVVAGNEVTKPNIVFILADDLGFGDVQCLNPGRGKIATPHLDRLAAQGMTLTDAHGGSSVCTPTRYGLLTGRYAWRTRLQAGVLDGGNDAPLIAENRLTLPTMLRGQGYATACIGKWHLGFRSESKAGGDLGRKGTGSSGLPLDATIIGGPTTRGFDYFWGCSNARTMASLIENDRVSEILPPIEMMPRLTARAVEYVSAAAASDSGRPFFLYLPLTSPHLPIVPSPAWQGKSDLGPYGDFVMQTDDGVGQILTALDQHKLSNNTLVIFTSDNGCAIQAGTARLEELGHYASGQYRGYKTDIWDGGHRVPFFVRWPNIIPAGTRSDALFCFTDMMATIAELLAVKLPDNAAEDSVSQWSVWRGASPSAPRQSIVHHSIEGQFAIRRGPWKLNFCAGSGGQSKPNNALAVEQGMPKQQLYSLDIDPTESNNLYAQNSEVVREMSALLQGYIDRGRSTEGTLQANDVPVRKPVSLLLK